MSYGKVINLLLTNIGWSSSSSLVTIYSYPIACNDPKCIIHYYDIDNYPQKRKTNTNFTKISGIKKKE